MFRVSAIAATDFSAQSKIQIEIIKRSEWGIVGVPGETPAGLRYPFQDVFVFYGCKWLHRIVARFDHVKGKNIRKPDPDFYIFIIGIYRNSG